MRSLPLRLFVVIVAAGSLGACQDGTSGGQATEPTGSTSGLVAALAQIEATADTRQGVAFTDLDALRGLAGPAPERTRYSGLLVGLDGIARDAARIAGPTGIDIKRVKRAFQAGRQPRMVGRLVGPFDAAVVGRKLTRLGYKPVTGTAQAWAAGPDGAVSLEGPLARIGVRGRSELNTVRVAAGGVTYSGTSRVLGLVPAADGRPTLAADPGFRAVGGCLGDAVAGRILGGAEVVSVGYQGRGREVLCVRVPEDAADAAVARLEATVTSGRSRTGRPWSELLVGAEVEKAGPGVVRLTARSGQARPGVMLVAASRDDLPNWRP